MEDKDIKIIDDETKEKIKKQVNDTKEKKSERTQGSSGKAESKTAGLLTVVTAVITFIVAYNGVKNILFNVALYNPVKRISVLLAVGCGNYCIGMVSGRSIRALQRDGQYINCSVRQKITKSGKRL